MATLTSLQDRIQGLGSRLQAENDSKTRDVMTNNLTLDFTRERPGSERRPKNCKSAVRVYGLNTGFLLVFNRYELL